MSYWMSLCLNALSSIVCFLTNIFGACILSFSLSLNALSSIVCFLTFSQEKGIRAGASFRLNALSSIVCFLTLHFAGLVLPRFLRLNALSSIVCFLTYRALMLMGAGDGSQCPLEHCMLSDFPFLRVIFRPQVKESQCPLEHCMLSDWDNTERGRTPTR